VTIWKDITTRKTDNRCGGSPSPKKDLPRRGAAAREEKGGDDPGGEFSPFCFVVIQGGRALLWGPILPREEVQGGLGLYSTRGAYFILQGSLSMLQRGGGTEDRGSQGSRVRLKPFKLLNAGNTECRGRCPREVYQDE